LLPGQNVPSLLRTCHAKGMTGEGPATKTFPCLEDSPHLGAGSFKKAFGLIHE
jgi:hypothetical protein